MKGRHHHEPRSSSSCAACKLLKRRCSPSCIFAPHFGPDEPIKFAKVHKVFGASNVSKILVEVPEEQRGETVNSLAYEAEARIRDPVYGCIGAIALLQRKMAQLEHDLAVARGRLACYAAAASSSYSTCCSVAADDDQMVMNGLDCCSCCWLGEGSGSVVSLGHDDQQQQLEEVDQLMPGCFWDGFSCISVGGGVLDQSASDMGQVHGGQTTFPI